jgi:cyanophycinase-like exopeptidase
MPGLICLQGGGEFSAGCYEMDAELLARVPGPVAVIALASPPGEGYARANAHGVSHFRRLGAEAFAVPDPREEEIGDTLRGVGLVVLPGGSPKALLEGLDTTGLAERLRAHVEAGGGVMGASAGAMALGSWVVLPDARFRLVPGLGLAQDVVVVPHWNGPRANWLKAINARVDNGLVLGIPEESGILLENGELTAVGKRATHLVREELDVGVGHTIRMP